MRTLALPFLALLSTPAAAQDLTLESRPSRWRLTAEYFEVDRNNDLGLVGAHFDLLNVAPDLLPGSYVGLGGYGAVSGTTGGLFFGGATVGWLRELYPGWSLDLGLLAGGGGGGGADTGNGLVLRPHAALEYALGPTALRLEVARVEFTSGDVESTHVALGLSLPGELLTADFGRQPELIPAGDLLWRRLRVTPGLRRIYTSSDNDKTDGSDLSDDLELAVLGLDYFLNERWYLPLEVAGAIGGGVGGFATVLGGLGLSLPLVGDVLRLESRALVGSGGGADVDTGGGLLLQGEAGLSWSLTPGVSLQVAGGYLNAPDGDLDGGTVTAGVSWNPRSAELGWTYPRSNLTSQGVSGALAKLDSTRLQALHKTYFPASSAKKKNGSDLDEAMHLVGLGVARPIQLLDQDFTLTARAFTAWEGGTGGYAEGLLGLQYELTPFANARFHTVVLRGEVGAGGGGDVDVSSGLLYHLAAGWRFQYTDNIAISLDLGSVEADRGSFEGESLTVGLSYILNRAVLRN